MFEREILDQMKKTGQRAKAGASRYTLRSNDSDVTTNAEGTMQTLQQLEISRKCPLAVRNPTSCQRKRRWQVSHICVEEQEGCNGSNNVLLPRAANNELGYLETLREG